MIKLAAGILFLALSTSTHSAVTVLVAQEGPNTIRFVATGSLDLSGLTRLTDGRVRNPDYFYLQGRPVWTGSSAKAEFFFRKAADPQGFYSGGLLESNFPRTDLEIMGVPSPLVSTLGIVEVGRLMLSSSYQSGDILTEDATMTGSLSSAGYEAGHYLRYSWMTDSGSQEFVAIEIVDAIPEPGMVPLAVVAVGIALGRRKRNEGNAQAGTLR
jgi:hypothetical protein